MPALPADIARFTTDGVLITLSDDTIKTSDPNATDAGESERESFFTVAADAEILANEAWALLKLVGRAHEAIETEDSIGLGTAIPVYPAAPRAMLRDERRNLKTLAIMRAYSFDAQSDTYAIEFVGTRAGVGDSFDSDTITLDETDPSWDNDNLS